MEWKSPQDLYNRLRTYLSIPIPINDTAKHLFGLDALRYELADKRTECMQALYEQKAKSLYPKEADKTDLDRKVLLDGFTAELQRDYEFLVQLEVIIADRLALGRTYLQKKDGL